jgi:hypothetical protein
MKAQLRRFSFSQASALVAVALGLAACGSSTPPAQPTGAAIGGGPSTALPSEMQAAAPFLNSVTSQVPSLSPSQAATGTGSLLGLAQARMPSDQFAQISNAIPGTNALIGGAHKAGLPSANSLTDLSSLSGVFQKAGISPDQVSQLVPAVASSISQSTAGPSAAQAFLSAIR